MTTFRTGFKVMRNNPLNNTPTMTASLLVWSFGALFYLFGFFHRVAPAVITAELMQDFHINASALGNLSAFYFYSYVAMQIPTGILADRWGPRRLLTMGAMTASIGAVMFGLASEFSLAGAGRFLIGGSVAVAFVALLKVAACWFAPNRFALVSGLALFFGIVGAVFAGTPLRVLVDSFGWRHVMLFSAAVTLIIGIGTWLFVRDYPHEKGFQDFPNMPSATDLKANSQISKGLLEVFAYRNTWLLFLVPGGVVGCVLTFSGLWGVPFLTSVYGLSPVFSASLTSLLLVAWAVGGPFFGWLSDRIRYRKRLYLAGCGISVAGWTVITLIENIPLALLVPFLLITGFASGSMIVSFAFAKESVPLRFSGTVSGIINMGVMTGPMILQPAVGLVLDSMWHGNFSEGVRVYDAAAYRSGFSIMLAWIVASFILLTFTRETNCRQMVE